MVKFAKYLSICVILASSRFIGATKFPTEDCTDKDLVLGFEKDTGSDYFASGSAHSSQFSMPDGSVLTNSKGSSISSDGIQRTFHELKKEANKFVSKSSSDGLTIPSGAIIPEIPGSNFSPFFKKNALSTGEQSSFSSLQSDSSGSSQYFDQQHFPQIPTDSKRTTFKKHEVKKFITRSASGLSSPEVTGEFDVEQSQGANANANIDTLVYKPVGAAIQSGYSNNHHQESESIKISSPSVNPEPDTVHKTIYYRPIPLKLYEREDAHGSEGTEVSGSSVNHPSTYGGKTIIYPPVPQSGASSSSSSSSSSKFESYSQRRDANADIPSYLVHNKPNTFTANVVDLDKIQDLKIPKIYSLPDMIPTTYEPIPRENHYASESHNAHSEQKETKQYAVPVIPVVSKSHNLIDDNVEVESHKPEELDTYGNKPVILSSEKIVAIPNTDGRHTRLKIKVQAPTETVGSSQIYRKETHSQSVKAFSADSGTDSAVLPESSVPKNEDVAQPVSLSTSQLQAAKHFEENVQKSGDTIQIPILLHGVPQNTGYSSKSSSSSSHSFSSGSQLGESLGGSQALKYTGGTTFDAGNLFGNTDKFSIPIQTYVSPVQTYVSPVQTYVSPQSSGKSSSSSSYHYFSSNGQAGEQLVPNSNIFANSDGSLHQSHGSLFKNLGKSSIGSDTEFVSSSLGVPQKNTYGFSTAYSSHSSNINGKVAENREAAVAVNDNGKIDSYHVKS